MTQILQFKKAFYLLIALIFSAPVLAQQGGIRGRIIDANTKEGLPGTNVVINGTTKGTITDLSGNFMIEDVNAGDKVLSVSYIGYVPREIPVSVDAGGADIGVIALESNTIGLKEVKVIASVATDRKTPVAISNIQGSMIEDRVGNQEFPEVLRSTPSVYVTKQGGGFGDSRINIRGFNQRNVAVMINGIPINDMENGWVYWSNWAGMSDVTSSLQVQRGLGATKLAVPSVGGSINIITNAAEMEKGGSFSVSYGNDNYNKYSLSYSTGLMDNGLAISAQGTHTRGNGYVDGTMFRGWSYFASIAKIFNDRHAVNLTGFGAPQWHNQRTFAETYANYQERGIKYNSDWGYLDGDEFSMRKNFYHKPQISLNHYWTISSKTELATSAYVSFGRGGGTGDKGAINGDAYYALPKTEEGLLRWEDIRRWNAGETVAGFGAGQIPWNGPGVEDPNAAYNGPFDGGNVAESYRNGIIRRASMNEHNWYGIISNFSHELSENLTLTAGLDARYYKGLHYRRVEDLLGLDAFYDDNDVNETDKYLTGEGRSDDNQFDYNNDGLVNWLGLYGQLEYSKNQFSMFASVSGSNQGFKRIDYFNYADSDPEQETDWQNFLGGTVKAGANYNLNAQHNVYINGGYFSRQPIFDNVFPFFTNEVNDDAKNQSVYAFEAGYGFKSNILTAKANLYHTQWGNRQFNAGVDANSDGEFDETAIFDDVAQLHQGVELELILQPLERLSIRGMASLGNWRYTDNFQATVVNDEQEVLAADVLLYMKDVKVADAAQTTYSLGATYELIKGLKIYGSYFHSDKLYAAFDLEQFLEAGNQVWELPSYGLMDAGVSYEFVLSGLDLELGLNVNNVLDEKYVSESLTNRIYDAEDAGDASIGNTRGSIHNQVYFGFGRTWNTSLKVRF